MKREYISFAPENYLSVSHPHIVTAGELMARYMNEHGITKDRVVDISYTVERDGVHAHLVFERSLTLSEMNGGE